MYNVAISKVDAKEKYQWLKIWNGNKTMKEENHFPMGLFKDNGALDLLCNNELGGIRYLAQLPPSPTLPQLGFQPPIVHANMQAQEHPHYATFPFLSHDKSCTFEMKVPLSISSKCLMILHGKK